MPIFRKMRLGTRFTIILLVFFVISIGLSGAALFRSMRTIAEESVTSNGLLLLHTMNAVRAYTSSQVNPLLAPVMAAQDKFIPESVPAFSAWSVFGKLRQDIPYQDFYYKEASTNPTAPQDRADEWETGVLLRFRADPKLQSESGFRNLNGQLVFYNARPMVVGDPACLACHTTPQIAPPAMVEQYGPMNGFGWTLNTVIAAQIVYVPAAEVYQKSWNTWISVMLTSVGSFALAVLAINLVLRRSVVRPVAQMAQLANRISNDQIDEEAPETLAAVAQRSDELGQMAKVFQRMAQEVYNREQALRQQVHELRIEIDEAKKARQVAELVETETFRDLRVKAQKLRAQHQAPGTGASISQADASPARRRVAEGGSEASLSDRHASQSPALPEGGSAAPPPARATETDPAPRGPGEPRAGAESASPGTEAAQPQSSADPVGEEDAEPPSEAAPPHLITPEGRPGLSALAAKEAQDPREPDQPAESAHVAPEASVAHAGGAPETPDEVPLSDAAREIFEQLKQGLTGLDSVNGITPLDILILPEDLQPPVKKMLRVSLTLGELAAAVALPESLANQLGEILVDKGFLEHENHAENNSWEYKVRLARVHPRNIPPGL